MNILYLTNSPVIGGAELSLLSHIEAMDKKEFRITLLCSEKLAERAKLIRGIDVKTMHFPILHTLNPIVIYRYIKMVRDVLKVVKSKHIDIIHSNSVKAHYIGVWVSLLSKAKLIWWIRDDTMNKLIFTLTRRIPFRIIYISEYIEKFYGKRRNSIVVYNGTSIYKHEIGKVKKEELRNHLNATGKIVVLCSERLVAWKGVRYLIDALYILKDQEFLCLIVGSGKGQRDNVEFDLIKYVSELKLVHKIKFLGWREDMQELYQIADIVVHPVIKPEPFGLVVIEAMSFGIPVIATSIGGPAEIIAHEEEGILVPPREATILASALNDLILSKELREKIGYKGQERVMQSFTQEKETYTIASLYRTIKSSLFTPVEM